MVIVSDLLLFHEGKILKCTVGSNRHPVWRGGLEPLPDCQVDMCSRLTPCCFPQALLGRLAGGLQSEPRAGRHLLSG